MRRIFHQLISKTIGQLKILRHDMVYEITLSLARVSPTGPLSEHTTNCFDYESIGPCLPLRGSVRLPCRKKAPTIIPSISTASESPSHPKLAMAEASTSSMAHIRNLKPGLSRSKISMSLTRSTSPLLSGPPTRISAGAIGIVSTQIEGLEKTLAMACGISRGTTTHPHLASVLGAWACSSSLGGSRRRRRREQVHR